MTVRKAIKRAEKLLPGVAAPEGEIDPRWQRIIDVGTYIDSEPEAIWTFVERWGTHEDEDLRAAVATCLLEHLLQHHFETIFPRVERLASSSRLFADTFSRCYRLGQAELPANAARFDALMKKVF
jgi:hypothetical protein